METLLAFLIALGLITFLTLRYHIPPFLTLISASILYGVLVGLQESLIVLVTSGAASIFALLGIPIFCGALIAQVLREGHLLEKIMYDVQRVSSRPSITAGSSGYLLALPFMCCITAFILVAPLIEKIGRPYSAESELLYIAAFGSVLSFVLLFPFPVVYAIVNTLELTDFDAVLYTAIALPISLIFLIAGGYALFHRHGPHNLQIHAQVERPAGSSWRAWAPVWIPLALIGLGYAFESLRLLGNINIALLIGAGIALLLVSGDQRVRALEKGGKNAGIILFDLCGAGALGAVIAASDFAQQVSGVLHGIIPLIFLPFFLAVLIQTAQGSRVVTAVITSSILTNFSEMPAIPAIPLVLMIAAGTMVFSYVSDPYFWLVKRSTGEDLLTVVKNYTIPLFFTGTALFVFAAILSLIHPY